MKEIAQQHAALDRFIAQVFTAHPEAKPCCLPGCCACCSEPVYASEAEVLHLLEYLTPEQTAEVKIKLPAWLAPTAPLLPQNMPDAVAWRSLRAPCVLLKNGLCSVYPRRPMGCRVWFALKNPDQCELPHRRHQLYASFPTDRVAGTINELVFVNDRFILDHLGVLLAEKLLGLKIPSGSRILDRFTPAKTVAP
jgi:Fe-S-cluster containining protein